MNALRIALASTLLFALVSCAKEQQAEGPATAVPVAAEPAATEPIPSADPTAVPAHTPETQAELASAGGAPTTADETAAPPAPAAKAVTSTESPMAEPPAPVKLDAQLVAAGRDLFRAKCAACHGAAGAGDTEIGRSRKLRELGSDGVQLLTDAEIRAILQGGKGPLSTRAHQSRSLGEEQIRALTEFIRSLR